MLPYDRIKDAAPTPGRSVHSELLRSPSAGKILQIIGGNYNEKNEKLAALCLAMLMAFSIMAVTASAYDAANDGIMPRYEIVACPKCGRDARVTKTYVHDEYYPASNCNNSGGFAHLHFYKTLLEVRTVCMYNDYDEVENIPIGNGTCLGK